MTILRRTPTTDTSALQSEIADAKATAAAGVAAGANARQMVLNRDVTLAELAGEIATLRARLDGFAVGSRPVGLLALGGSTNVVVPLSRAMLTTAYQWQAAHSAVVDLSGVTVTVVTKTTTSLTLKVTATGLALAAGTLTVVAI